MDQVIGELAGGEVVAELPTVAAKDEECANGVASRHGICETHDLERDLLLGGAAGLLPLEGDEDAIMATGRDCVDLVGASAAARADRLLFDGLISAARQRRQNHRLQNAASVGVSWRHMLRVPRISPAGVRSPVQLIRRGAARKRMSNRSLR
jgi:hypothetical protein